MVVLVAVPGVALFLILSRTRLGTRIRAGTRDLETVSTLGVNIRVLRRVRFLGIPVERHTCISFTISCFVSLAGALDDGKVVYAGSAREFAADEDRPAEQARCRDGDRIYTDASGRFRVRKSALSPWQLERCCDRPCRSDF